MSIKKITSKQNKKKKKAKKKKEKERILDKPAK